MARADLLVSASMTEYGSSAHNLLNGYEFDLVDAKDNSNTDIKYIIIKKPDGSIVSPYPVLGREWDNKGTTELDDNGDLVVGKYKVHRGKNLMPSWHATKSIGKTFNVFSDNGIKYKAKVGEYFQPVGAVLVGQDSMGNLSFDNDERSIKFLKKTKVISIIVTKDTVGSGFNSYINEETPGSKSNKKDGVKGIFYPKNGNVPAYFTTKYNGIDVVTAIFETDKINNSLNVRMFSADDAMEIKAARSRMRKIKEECISFDINPHHHQEFSNLSDRIEKIKGNSILSSFDVFVGQNQFDLKIVNSGFKRKSHNNSYGYTR